MLVYMSTCSLWSFKLRNLSDPLTSHILGCDSPWMVSPWMHTWGYFSLKNWSTIKLGLKYLEIVQWLMPKWSPPLQTFPGELSISRRYPLPRQVSIASEGLTHPYHSTFSTHLFTNDGTIEVALSSLYFFKRKKNWGK